MKEIKTLALGVIFVMIQCGLAVFMIYKLVDFGFDHNFTLPYQLMLFLPCFGLWLFQLLVLLFKFCDWLVP